MNEQAIRLELSKEPIPAQIIRMGQGDSEGTTIVATIFDHGLIPSLSGFVATFLMRLPDGVHYVRDSNCTIAGNVITYVVDEEHCCAVAGYTDEAYFEVVSGSTEYSTSRFRVKVERAAHDGTVPAESWDTEIDQLIERGEQAVSDTEQAVGDATSAIDAANQAIARIEPTIEQAAEDAAGQATADAEQRIQDAIDAMGDISELAVPLMSPDVRGGAKLEEHGGLALRDGALGIGSLVQQSDGYARGGLAEVTAKGHAEQDTTTGKNLLQPPLVNTTSEGISWSNNSNGEVIANGTATSEIPSTHFSRTLAAGTYMASGASSEQNSLFRATVNGRVLFSVHNRASAVFTLESDTMVDFRFFVYQNAGTYTNYVFDCQLELGSTATSYEPYTGGAPSPSPDYPQEIQVVRGRNLLDPSMRYYSMPITTNGITFSSDENDGIRVNGTASADAFFPLVTNAIGFLKAGVTYTYTCDGITSGIIAQVSYHASEGSSTVYLMSFSSGQSGTFTVPSSAYDFMVRIYVESGKTINNVTVYPQLTLGSTPQPYVPYGHVGMEVQGKNLLPTTEFVTRTGSPTIEKAADGGIHIYKSAGGDGQRIDLWNDPSNPIVLTSPGILNVPEKHGGFDFSIGDATSASSGASLTGLTTQATVQPGIYTRISIYTSNSAYDVVIYPQLELGTEVTEYEPYHHTTTPIPLPSRGWVADLPDGTADSLTLDGAGKCEWTLPTGEVVLDGSESGWASEGSYASTGGGFYAIYTKTTAIGLNLMTNGSAMIDKLSAMGINVGTDNHGIIGYKVVGGSVLRVRAIETTDAQNVSAFVAWLSQNPLTLLGKLITPVTEDCGYVGMPAIPSDATVTIPELDALGIKYFVDDAVTQYGREIYARVRSEYADRITALEQVVAELATS